MAQPTEAEILAGCLTSQQNLRNSRLFNVPPFRYTPVSPYNGTVTQFDLDMRRKAEVLKYNKNTNGKLTKKQNWTQTVAGSLQRRTYSQTAIQTIISGGVCDDITRHPTPTTSSGVPGPVMNLYYDPSVNLYNYSTNFTSYATENYEETDMWLTKSDTDILSLNPTVFTLNIRKPIDKTFYKYSFEVPVALYINGYSYSNDICGNFTATIDAPTISVSYGGQPFILSTPPLINTTNMIQDISGISNYDISGAFNGAIYLGTIAVSNLVLLTNPGSTYDVDFSYIISTTNTNISAISASMYTNVGAVFATSNVLKNGMTFNTLPSSAYKPPLILTGE
jgi:hypothetical protein